MIVDLLKNKGTCVILAQKGGENICIVKVQETHGYGNIRKMMTE